jgi:hypothetical protein
MRRGREGSGLASCVAVSASRPFAEEVRAVSATITRREAMLNPDCRDAS